MNEEILQQAKEYLAKECYIEAIALLQSLNNHPTPKSFSWYLGLAWFLQLDESEAEKIWMAALLEATDAETQELINILVTEAQQQLQRRKLTIAAKLYSIVIDLDDSEPNNYFNYGIALAQLGDFDEAIASMQQAVELNPTFLEAYQFLAAVHQKLDEYPQAITAYTKALEIQPDSVNSLYNLGLCYLHQNQLDTAISLFQTCLEIAPDASVYGDLGYVLFKQGKLDEGIFSWQQAMALTPKIFEDYSTWIENLSQENLPVNQLILTNAALLQALPNQRSRGKIYFKLANILSRIPPNEVAIKCYYKALEYNYKPTECYYQLVISLLQDNQIEEALINLKELAKLDNTLSEKIVKTLKNNRQNNNLNTNQSLLNGFYETTQEWAVKCNLVESNYFPIYEENIINLTPPLTTDQYIHYSYRFGDQIQLPASFVVIIPSGRFWLSEDEASSAVITPDNKILGDISCEFPVFSPGHPDNHPSKHSIFQRSTFPDFQYIDGTVVILSGLLNNIYFHWLFDILPRIHLLERSGIDLNTIDYFVVSNNLPFQKESLEKLGIPDSKILKTENYRHIQATKLIVPSFPSTIAWMPKWVCDFIKQTFLGTNLTELSANKLIYITRKTSNSRRIINEQEIITLLEKNGFETIDLEGMSIKEQALLLAQAKVVIAPHGSGLSNLVFCQENTKVIEIFSPYYVYPCYWLLANLVCLEYYYLIGESYPGLYLHKFLYPDSRIEDIYVNLKSWLDMSNLAKIY